MIGKTTIATHNGGFHADDVFAVATILLFLEKDIKDVEIIRSRDPEDWESADFVLDVGNEYDPEKHKFDHHQRGGAGERENGVSYASFGLVWKEYGAKICDSEDVAERLDKRLVQTIDAIDNGFVFFESDLEDTRPYTISDAVSSFVSFDATDGELLLNFKEVVGIASNILAGEIARASREDKTRIRIIEAYGLSENKEIIILDDAKGWGREFISEVLADFPEPVYFVREHRSVGWQVVAVGHHNYSARKDLPQNWAGKRDEELREVTGVPDAVFCHNKRFMCVAESKEGAISLAQKALEK